MLSLRLALGARLFALVDPRVRRRRRREASRADERAAATRATSAALDAFRPRRAAELVFLGDDFTDGARESLSRDGRRPLAPASTALEGAVSSRLAPAFAVS